MRVGVAAAAKLLDGVEPLSMQLHTEAYLKGAYNEAGRGRYLGVGLRTCQELELVRSRLPGPSRVRAEGPSTWHVTWKSADGRDEVALTHSHAWRLGGPCVAVDWDALAAEGDAPVLATLF